MRLLEQIAAVGGPEALRVVVTTARSPDDLLQDAATRLLGEWLTADAAPELLGLAKTLASGKYRIRALRGYIHIARQLNMTPEDRLEVCRNTLAIAERPEEKFLAVETLGRIRSPESLAAAAAAEGQGPPNAGLCGDRGVGRQRCHDRPGGNRKGPGAGSHADRRRDGSPAS